MSLIVVRLGSELVGDEEATAESVLQHEEDHLSCDPKGEQQGCGGVVGRHSHTPLRGNWVGGEGERVRVDDRGYEEGEEVFGAEEEVEGEVKVEERGSDQEGPVLRPFYVCLHIKHNLGYMEGVEEEEGDGEEGVRAEVEEHHNSHDTKIKEGLDGGHVSSNSHRRQTWGCGISVKVEDIEQVPIKRE